MVSDVLGKKGVEDGTNKAKTAIESRGFDTRLVMLKVFISLTIDLIDSVFAIPTELKTKECLDLRKYFGIQDFEALITRHSTITS